MPAVPEPVGDSGAVVSADDAADSVPLLTDSPLPTMTAPAAPVVASGRRADASVPVVMFAASCVCVVFAAPMADAVGKACTWSARDAADDVPAAAVPNAEGVASDRDAPPPPPVADNTPLATARPLPTCTAPSVAVVAAGSRAAGNVPTVRSDALPLVATADRPETSAADSVMVPVRPATDVTLLVPA